MIKFRIISVGLILAGVVGIAGLPSESFGRGRVIEFGWDTPTIPWFCENAAKVECSVPFHGMVLDLAKTPEKAGLSRHVWVSDQLSSAFRRSAAGDIALINDANFTRLIDDSFVRINSSGWTPPADWFDSGFSTVIFNITIVANMINNTSLAGIAFDPEDYHYNCWIYPDQKYSATKTFEQYKAQVRLRGREVADAIVNACPDRDFVMLFMFANSQPYISTQWWGHPLSQDSYGLLPAFIDGLLDEPSGRIKVIDGIESAYPNKTREIFLASIGNYQGGAAFSADTARYLSRVGVGFGTWMDYRSDTFGWYTDPNQFNLNHFTPETFNQAVDSATDLSEYLWIYTQVPDWYLETVPQAYSDAVSDVTALPVQAPQADLNGDCAVDYEDLGKLGQQWLTTGSLTADLSPDNKVDYRDFAVLADQWLEDALRPKVPLLESTQ